MSCMDDEYLWKIKTTKIPIVISWLGIENTENQLLASWIDTRNQSIHGIVQYHEFNCTIQNQYQELEVFLVWYCLYTITSPGFNSLSVLNLSKEPHNDFIVMYSSFSTHTWRVWILAFNYFKLHCQSEKSINHNQALVKILIQMVSFSHVLRFLKWHLPYASTTF